MESMNILDWFKPKERILVVEVEHKYPIVEDENVILSLADHPGFHMLMQRFKRQKDYVDSTLRSAKHEDIRAVDALQIWSQALTFCEDTIHKLTTKRERPKPVVPERTVEDQFKEIRAAITGA